MTTITEHAVTAQDKRALRSADRVFLRMHKGASEIVAVKDERNSSTGFEQQHAIPCRTSINDHAESYYSRDDHEHYSGYSSWYDRDSIAAVLDGLHLGQVITLRWTRGNDSQNVRDIHWRTDEVHVLLIDAKTGKRRAYLIDRQTGPVNSASLVRRLPEDPR